MHLPNVLQAAALCGFAQSICEPAIPDVSRVRRCRRVCGCEARRVEVAEGDGVDAVSTEGQKWRADADETENHVAFVAIRVCSTSRCSKLVNAFGLFVAGSFGMQPPRRSALLPTLRFKA